MLKAVQLLDSSGVFLGNEKKKRAPISAKLRFEVFKRDKFTCQYCGKSAASADVLIEARPISAAGSGLHLDHVDPVKLGGDNDITNLITACVTCNLGKGATPLGQGTLMQNTVKQMEDLQARRDLLKMVAQWRSELKTVKSEAISSLVSYAEQTPFGHVTITKEAVSELSKALKKHPIEDIFQVIDDAQEQKSDPAFYDDEDEISEGYSKRLGVLLRQIGRPEYEAKLSYAAGILRNRFERYFSSSRAGAAIKPFMDASEALIEYKLDQNDQSEGERRSAKLSAMMFEAERNVIRLAKEASSFDEFCTGMNTWAAGRIKELAELRAASVTTKLSEEQLELNSKNLVEGLSQMIYGVDATPDISPYLFLAFFSTQQRPLLHNDQLDPNLIKVANLFMKGMFLEYLAYLTGQPFSDEGYSCFEHYPIPYTWIEKADEESDPVIWFNEAGPITDGISGENPFEKEIHKVGENVCPGRATMFSSVEALCVLWGDNADPDRRIPAYVDAFSASLRHEIKQLERGILDFIQGTIGTTSVRELKTTVSRDYLTKYVMQLPDQSVCVRDLVLGKVRIRNNNSFDNF